MFTKLILSVFVVFTSCFLKSNINLKSPNPFSLPPLANTKSLIPSIQIPNIQTTRSIAQSIQIPNVQSLRTSSIISSPAINSASKLGITAPTINFAFPTQKFTAAGSVFQTITPITTTSTNTSTVGQFSNSTFSGFSSVYKNEMAYLIAGIKQLNTTQGKLLSDKLTMDLISIDNTLKLISMNQSKQIQLKPLLQFQVKQFLSDLDMIQDHLQKYGNTNVSGNSNLVMGNNSIISGNSNAAIGNTNAVIGSNNALIGNNSIVSGYNNGVVGNNGVTIGLNNEVKANNTYVFTSNDVVNKDNTMVIGDYSIDLYQLSKQGGSYITKN